MSFDLPMRLVRSGSSARPVLLLVATAVALSALPSCAASSDRTAPGRAVPQAEARARAAHLLSRATWGARPEDMERVLRIGPGAWLDEQLHPERIPDASVTARLARYPAAAMPVARLFEEFPPPQQLRDRLLRERGIDIAALRPDADMRPDSVRGGSGMMGDSARPSDPDRLRRAIPADVRRELARRNPNRILAEMVGAKIERAVASERQLEEVMTDFWFNHFNVFFGKNQVRYLTSDYEREAIRPHVFGRFEDMLVATARHPAMLVYLDNWMSSAADPRGEGDAVPGAGPPRPGRSRGINENYARELLELHTLGVDGGYTQQDVMEVARAFTGWSIRRPGQNARDDAASGFVFRPFLHDRGEKLVLGHRLAAARGEEDGREVLRMLAGHPSTAKHIAYKLVERFVSDTPPPDFVEEIAGVFSRTGGDLREVTRALFTSDRFYDDHVRGTKVKTPYEFVASALRVSGAQVMQPRGVIESLRTLGNLPYSQSAPTGYPATMPDWVNSGALLSRMNFALALSAGRIQGTRADPTHGIRKAIGSDAEAVVAELAARYLPGMATDRLQNAVLADLRTQQALDGDALRGRAAGLILGSREFQRR